MGKQSRLPSAQPLGRIACHAILGLALFSLCACQEEPLPPFGPDTGSTIQPGVGLPGPTKPDADAGMDGGSSDGGVGAANECMVISSGSLDSTLSSPIDFAPMYATATWAADCSDPTLTLRFAEDDCADGTGHELQIQIRAEAAMDLLLPGANPVTDLLLSAVAIRYQRPGATPPAGLWGTCAGVGGQLEVLALDPTVTGTVSLGLSLDLTDCTEAGRPAQPLEGQLSVFLARDLSTACPGR